MCEDNEAMRYDREVIMVCEVEADPEPTNLMWYWYPNENDNSTIRSIKVGDHLDNKYFARKRHDVSTNYREYHIQF